MHEDSNSEDWPPPQARLQSILWRAEGHLLRAEYGQASRTLGEAQNGEGERARRQLAHARRRLAPFLPESREVEVARLLDAIVESADGELA
jgi:hypothetical protein